jgi:hypothetical protein
MESSRALPVLQNIRIATPCSESWDGMVGNDRVRYCGGCEKNVYNLSAMTELEAQELIAGNEGELCMRLFRRKDGTVITSDCPVGVRRQRVTKIAAAALALGGAGLALALVDNKAELEPCPSNSARYTRARPVGVEPAPVKNDKPSWLESLLVDDDEPEVLMGEPVPEPTMRMGKIAVPHPPTAPAPSAGRGLPRL